MKKFLALILAIMTMFSLAAVSALAEDGETGGETPAGSEQTQPAVNTPRYDGEITIEADENTGVQPVVVVEIEWGPAMSLKYCDETKKYDPVTHEYTTTKAHWEGTDNTYITVTNHSNVKVDAFCTITLTDAKYMNAGLCMGTDKNNTRLVAAMEKTTKAELPHAVGKTEAPSETFYIDMTQSVRANLFGSAIPANTKMCDISIKIEPDTKVAINSYD